MSAHWAGIGWGYANISNADYKTNDIDGVSLKAESSNEFYVNLIDRITSYNVCYTKLLRFLSSRLIDANVIFPLFSSFA